MAPSVFTTGVSYFISPTYSEERANQLKKALDEHGAVPALDLLDATHVITNSNKFHGWDNLESSTFLVTDKWVERSVTYGKTQNEKYYSPDPAMIFSGVVATSAGLTDQDVEVLSAGIHGLGGRWSSGLTHDCTHLFVIGDGTSSDKYHTALHFQPTTDIKVVLPHWFDDAMRLGYGALPTKEYEWPDPSILLQKAPVADDDEAFEVNGRMVYTGPKFDSARKTLYRTAGLTFSPEELRIKNVWGSRKILLSSSLELIGGRRDAIEASIGRAGGVVIQRESDDDEEAKVEEADIYVTKWRSGGAYIQAVKLCKIIGTLSWLFHVQAIGTITSPVDQLLHYPTPKALIEGFANHEITITNYTGDAREYIKRLIITMGASFTPSMSGKNTVLVAAYIDGNKTTKARNWSIPVVNHTWLEDCFVQWRNLTPATEKYIVFPPSVNFVDVLGHRGLGDVDLLAEAQSELQNEGDDLCGTPLNRERVVESKSPTKAPLSIPIEPPVGTATSAKDRMEVEDAVSSFQDHNAESDENLSGDSYEDAQQNDDVEMDEVPKPVQITEISPSTPAVLSNRRGTANKAATCSTPSHLLSSSPVKHIYGSTSKSVKKTVVINASDDSDSPDPMPSSSKMKKPKKPIVTKKILTKVKSDQVHDSEDEDEPQPSKLRRGKGKAIAKHQLDTDDEDERVSSRAHKRKAKAVLSDDDDIGQKSPRFRSGTQKAVRSTPINSFMQDEESQGENELVEEGSPISRGKPRVKGKHKADEKPLPSRPAQNAAGTDELGTSAKNRPSTKSSFKRVASVVIPVLPAKGKNALIPSSSKSRAVTKTTSIKATADESPSLKRRTMKVIVEDLSPSSDGSEIDPVAVVSTEKSLRQEKSSSAGPTDDELEVPSPSLSRAPSKRYAAVKASRRLKEDIMPDVLNYEQQKRNAAKRGTGDRGLKSFDMPSKDLLATDDKELQGDKESSKRLRRLSAVQEQFDNASKRRRITKSMEEDGDEDDEFPTPIGRTKNKSAPKGKRKEVEKLEVVEDATKEPVKSPEKKSKQVPTSTNPASDPSSSRQRPKVLKLLTTSCTLQDDIKKALLQLGVKEAVRAEECTHLMVPHIVRTENFIVALSYAPFIVTVDWAIKSAKAKKLLPESDFAVHDPVHEAKYKFKLSEALSRSAEYRGSLFAGHTFYLSPKASSVAPFLAHVVSACGGRLSKESATRRILDKTLQPDGSNKRHFISCKEDISKWREAATAGHPIYTQEIILTSALRQAVEWNGTEFLVEGSY